MKIKKYFTLTLLSFLLILSSTKVESAQIMGSDMSWDCIGQDSFMVTVNIYRDCNGINFSNILVSVICETSSQTLQTLNIPMPTPVDITPVCLSNCTRCDSGGCSFPYGIEKYAYQKLMILSNAGSCCQIKLVWTSCCRNSAITTGLAGQNFWCEAILNRCISPCDNSPEFSSLPISIICLGQDFIFNNGATDTDTGSYGALIDSLSYEWVYPMGSGGATLSYNGQYDYDKPIFFWGFPNTHLPFPRGFHLDPYTGDIMIRPMKKEQTVMAMKVKEYRNGVKIGELTRDIQIIVIDCPTNHAPELGGPFYKEVCAGSTITFNIYTNDYDPSDTVTISWDHSIYGANWSDNNDSVKHPTGTLTWTPAEQQSSNIPYLFRVTARDNACPVNGINTRAYQVLVKPIPKAKITVVDSGCGDYYFKVNPLAGAAPSYLWIGNFNPGFQKTGDSIHYKFNDTGTYPYTMTMTAGTSALTCSRTFFDTIEIKDFVKVSLPGDTTICEGDNVKIFADYNSNLSLKQLFWSTGDTNTNPLNLTNLFSDTTLIVTAINDSGCIATDTMYIYVDNFRLSPFQINPVCDGEEASLYANPIFDIGKQMDSLKWLGLSCGCAKSTNDTFQTYFAAPYIVIAYNEKGCMAKDTITSVVHPLPGISSYLNGDYCIDHPTIGLDSFFEPKGGQWTLQGQNISQLDFSALNTGSYQLTYGITDSNNCYNELQLGFDVHALPIVHVPDADSICSNTGHYPLSGLPDGGIWMGNPVSQSGQNYYINTDSVTVNNSNVFPLIYLFIDSNACSIQDTFALTIIETKNISFQRMKGCLGDTIELHASPAGGNWTGQGVSGSKLYTSQTGTGDQKVYYSYNHMGCISDDSVIINIIPYPDDHIQISNDSIIAEQGYSMYQWYRNDTLLSGENNYYILPILSGDYHCEISNNYGCLTKTQKIAFSSINDFTQKDFSVYPNPVISGLLTIDVSKLDIANYHLLILDELGKQIYFEVITNNPGKINRKIEFPASGSYTVMIISGGKRYFKSIIVK